MAVVPATTTRAIFADQLRGIAALLVVVNHYTGIYWVARPLVASVTFSPAQDGATHALALMAQAWPFNPGVFGVGLFFLISGFVIPNAFTHHSPASFLAARALRIWPCYLAAMAVELIATWLSAHYWSVPFTERPVALLANALLVHNLLGVPTFDLVNWTLTIELKFYLLFALAHAAIARRPGRCVLGAGVMAALLCATVPWGLAVAPGERWEMLTRGISLDLQYVPFMLVGTLFHLHGRGRLGTARLAGLTVATLALVALGFRLTRDPVEIATVLPNYLKALALFALAYSLRRHIGGTLVTRWLARISYPLYLVHSLVGYAMLKWLMMGVGLGYVPALALTLASVLGIATLLHVFVERPSIAAGRRLGRRKAARDPAGGAVATA